MIKPVPDRPRRDYVKKTQESFYYRQNKIVYL